MKKTAALLAFAGAIATVGLLADRSDAVAQEANSRQPVLVELFTSQGCSSCPPADRLAAKLAREEGLVVISRPVTYWDRLGWKDTLAREANTTLQRSYARRGLAGKNGVYTPQVVVDGKRGAVGSNEAFIRQMISWESKAPAAIGVRKLDDGSLAIGLAGTTGKPAELALIGLRDRVTVRIAAGENGNRAIGYTNVLTGEQVVADWSGGKEGVRIPARLLDMPKADRYALVLREKNAGAVLATRLVS